MPTPTTLAKDHPKYIAMVVAGLLIDETVLEEERRWRAIPPKTAVRSIWRAAHRPAARWIQISGDPS